MVAANSWILPIAKMLVLMMFVMERTIVEISIAEMGVK